MAKRVKSIGLLKALQLSAELKRSYVRPKTAQEYKNHLERFEIYLKSKKLDKMKLEDFDKNQAIFYLDDVLVNRKVLTMTRNNYMRVMKALFGTLVEREYILINPFAGIPRLKETKKKRRTFSKEEKQVIIKYVKSKDKRLFLAICLCYYCAIRPVELRRLKLSNIDLKSGLIQMDGSQTKNKECATITIPKVLVAVLESLELSAYPKDYYLFGANNLEPNIKPSGRDTISKRHQAALKELERYGFLSDMENKTFYSWKDTSAKDLIEQGLNILDLKQHFRHKEISTTQKYIEMHTGLNIKIRDIDLGLW